MSMFKKILTQSGISQNRQEFRDRNNRNLFGTPKWNISAGIEWNLKHWK